MRAVSCSWASVVVGLGLLLTAAPARAEQFVLLDVTFTFTKADADNATPSKSHYYVKSDRLNQSTPIDWTKPIDYRNGRVHVRTEVMDKPAGGAETRWTLCYIARKGIDAGYGCSNTAAYKEEGVWEFEQGMTEWWQNDDIDWTQGIKQMDLVMKDSNGVFAHTMPDPEHWFPTTLRITMIQVSAGATYDESLVPNLPLGNAGAGGGGGTGGAGGAGSAGVAGALGDAAAGGTNTASAPTAGAGAGGSSGAPSSSPSAGTSNGGSNAGSSGTTGSGTPPAAPGGPHDDGGCRFGAPRAPVGGLMGAALALAFTAARRRRRR